MSHEKLNSVMFEITDQCNLQCKHCLNRPDCKNIMVEYERVKQVIEKCDVYGTKKIFLSGGEPLLHDSIIEIIGLCGSFPNIMFYLTTNGLLLTKKIMKEIEKYDNITFQFSVDGVTKFPYESLRGENTFEMFKEKIQIWDASSVRMGLARTCLTKHNYKEISYIYEYCLQHKLIPSFVFVDALGNGKENWNYLQLSLAEKVWSINEINKMNYKYNYSITPPEAPATCNFTEGQGVASLLIRADGRIAPCQHFYNDSIGNIFTDEIEDILSHEQLERYRTIAAERRKRLAATERCQSCKIKDGCNFGCVGKAEFLGDIMSYDGLCGLRIYTTLCYSNNLITSNDKAQKVNTIRLNES